MTRIEKQYRKINDAYNQFSYAVIADDTNNSNRKMLKSTTKNLAKELKVFWNILNGGGTEEWTEKT